MRNECHTAKKTLFLKGRSKIGHAQLPPRKSKFHGLLPVFAAQITGFPVGSLVFFRFRIGQNLSSFWLVLWNMAFMTFHYQLGRIIIPTDFHSIIFQRGRLNHQPDIPFNVNPGLINHGLLIRGGTPPIVIIWYLNGTLPIKQSRGLLIQGWH